MRWAVVDIFRPEIVSAFYGSAVYFNAGAVLIFLARVVVLGKKRTSLLAVLKT
jgi:hypothetical protein